jgi:hypothetical protein
MLFGETVGVYCENGVEDSYSQRPYVFPVRYKPNFMLFRRNSVFEGLNTIKPKSLWNLKQKKKKTFRFAKLSTAPSRRMEKSMIVLSFIRPPD